MTMSNPGLFVRTIAEALGDKDFLSVRGVKNVTTSDVYQSRRQRQREAEHFARVRNAYYGYASKLRRIARHVADIIRAYPPGDPAGVEAINRYLRDYSYILRPWARQAGALMIAEVSRRDYTAWVRHARMLGRELQREVLTPGTPTSLEVNRILDDQMELITSIPLEAAERVQELSREYWTGGKRYDQLVRDILASSTVTHNRATLIARTETAKTSAAVTQARATEIGSFDYVWHTVGDADVRPMHQHLAGRTFRWDDPPVAEASGERHHPGEFPNCRCWAIPNLPPPEAIGDPSHPWWLGRDHRP